MPSEDRGSSSPHRNNRLDRLLPSSWLGWVIAVLAVAVLASALLRMLVVDVYTVQQESMHPTLQDGERIAVQKQHNSEARRGDVVVFNGEGSFTPYRGSTEIFSRASEQLAHWVGLGSPEEMFVKRIIGTGGDTVECCDAKGRLLVNGRAMEEPYLDFEVTAETPASELEFDVEVPQGRIWVMGDHRRESVDSRALLGAPGGGMISEDRIIGRVSHVLWPWSQRRSIQEFPYEQ